MPDLCFINKLAANDERLRLTNELKFMSNRRVLNEQNTGDSLYKENERDRKNFVLDRPCELDLLSEELCLEQHSQSTVHDLSRIHHCIWILIASEKKKYCPK